MEQVAEAAEAEARAAVLVDRAHPRDRGAVHRRLARTVRTDAATAVRSGHAGARAGHALRDAEAGRQVARAAATLCVGGARAILGLARVGAEPAALRIGVLVADHRAASILRSRVTRFARAAALRVRRIELARVHVADVRATLGVGRARIALHRADRAAACSVVAVEIAAVDRLYASRSVTGAHLRALRDTGHPLYRLAARAAAIVGGAGRTRSAGLQAGARRKAHTPLAPPGTADIDRTARSAIRHTDDPVSVHDSIGVGARV